MAELGEDLQQRDWFLTGSRRPTVPMVSGALARISTAAGGGGRARGPERLRIDAAVQLPDSTPDPRPPTSSSHFAMSCDIGT